MVDVPFLLLPSSSFVLTADSPSECPENHLSADLSDLPSETDQWNGDSALSVSPNMFG